MKKFIVFLFFLFLLYPSNVFSLEKSNKVLVSNFLDSFKKNDRNKISNMIYYPFQRKYPIPPINNQKEFLNRFDEVFDKKTTVLIKNSSIKNWDEIGWRGIALNNGDVWINFEGKVYAIPNLSDIEKSKRKNLIQKEKDSIHKSLRNFEEPIMQFKTKNYFVRIDKIDENKYRYSSWDKSKSQLSKPKLVLYGNVNYMGTGGNHEYIFKNGDYIYTCNIIIIGEKINDLGYLKVSIKGKELLSEKFLELKI